MVNIIDVDVIADGFGIEKTAEVAQRIGYLRN